MFIHVVHTKFDIYIFIMIPFESFWLTFFNQLKICMQIFDIIQSEKELHNQVQYNAVVYVAPFRIGQCQVFAGINYTIDEVKQFAHVETKYICIL